MRRGRLEILFDILEAIETEGNPTNIMFKTSFLVEAGFAELRENSEWRGGARERKRYLLTEKGRKLLYYGREIRKLLNEGEI